MKGCRSQDPEFKNQKRQGSSLPLRHSRRSQPCQHLDFSTKGFLLAGFWPPETQENKCEFCSSHKVYVNWLQLQLETNTENTRKMNGFITPPFVIISSCFYEQSLFYLATVARLVNNLMLESEREPLLKPCQIQSPHLLWQRLSVAVFYRGLLATSSVWQITSYLASSSLLRTPDLFQLPCTSSFSWSSFF